MFTIEILEKTKVGKYFTFSPSKYDLNSSNRFGSISKPMISIASNKMYYYTYANVHTFKISIKIKYISYHVIQFCSLRQLFSLFPY